VQQALECFKKGPQVVKLEIQAFRIHLESLHVHQEAKLHVKATMVLERRTWGWSPLYHAFTKAEGGLPAHIKRPFLHTNDELSQMLKWVADDILPRLQFWP
jgi:hypothetical protein